MRESQSQPKTKKASRAKKPPKPAAGAARAGVAEERIAQHFPGKAPFVVHFARHRQRLRISRGSDFAGRRLMARRSCSTAFRAPEPGGTGARSGSMPAAQAGRSRFLSEHGESGLPEYQRRQSDRPDWMEFTASAPRLCVFATIRSLSRVSPPD